MAKGKQKHALNLIYIKKLTKNERMLTILLFMLKIATFLHNAQILK